MCRQAGLHILALHRIEGKENSKTVKYNNKRNTLKFMAAAIIAVSGLMSCNKEAEPFEPYLTPSNVAVTAFSFAADDAVMANLDSVFFSIDLKNGVIFNADSLPVGTKIDKLVPSIKYSSYITGATIKMEGGQTRTGEVNYIESPTDSIDFTGNVTLTLSTDEGALTKDYLIKVNVHKQKSDSIIWGDEALAKLPSRLNNPKAQKSLDFSGRAVSLIEEADGSYTLANSTDLFNNVWNRQQVSFQFTPQVPTLTASSEKLYILDLAGDMYESEDGMTWTPTGEKWVSVIGGYLDTAIGIKQNGNAMSYAQYPLKNLKEQVVDSEFPIKGRSNFVILENKWTTSPVGFFVGGEMPDGSLSNVTWAFDGANWIKLSEYGIPNIKGASLIPYYSYRYTQSVFTPTEYPVWLLLGGSKKDNTLNRTVYVSYDNGVNWSEGSELMQLPKEIPAMSGCDNVVMYSPREAKLSDYWTRAGGSTPVVDGNLIKWDCPYIYLIGGENSQGGLYDTIWRGALARLMFTPIL